MGDLFDKLRMNETHSATIGLYYALGLGGATTLVSLVLFEVGRRFLPTVFEFRKFCKEHGLNRTYEGEDVVCPPSPSRWPLGWLYSALSLDLDALVLTHGLDTAMFLRFLRSQIVLFSLLTVLCCTILLPVYGTGSNRSLPEDDPLRVEGLDVVSLANVNQGDNWRFWITLLWDCFVALVVYAVMFRGYARYTKYRRNYRCSDNPSNFAIIVQDIPRKHRSEERIREYWEKLFPGQIAAVRHILNANNLLDKKRRFWEAVTRKERAQWKRAYKLMGENPTHRPGRCGWLFPKRKKVDSIEYWSREQERLHMEVREGQGMKDHKRLRPTGAALVLFQTKRAASAAVQISSARREYAWRVERASEPDAVDYPKLRITGPEVPLRALISVFAIAALILFWFIPITFLQGLANLQALSEIELNGAFPLSFLLDIKQASPAVVGFVEGLLPPALLSLFINLVPHIIRILAGISRVQSKGTMDLVVRNTFFIFLVFSNFLYVVVSGSLLQQLAAIIQQPALIVDLLSNSIPGQGIFMMTYIIVEALSSNSKEMLQVGRVLGRWFRRARLKTTREFHKADQVDCEYVFYQQYGLAQLVSLIGIVYTTIAPTITVVCLIYFLSLYVTAKYTLCYSKVNPYADGGRMFSGAFYAVLAGLALHQLTMIGLMSLKSQRVQGAFEIVAFLFTLAYAWYCFRRFHKISNHGALIEIIERHELENTEDKIPQVLADLYQHPGLSPLPDVIPNLSGVEGDPVDQMEKGSSGKEGFGQDVRDEAEGDSKARDESGEDSLDGAEKEDEETKFPTKRDG